MGNSDIREYVIGSGDGRGGDWIARVVVADDEVRVMLRMTGRAQWWEMPRAGALRGMADRAARGAGRRLSGRRRDITLPGADASRATLAYSLATTCPDCNVPHADFI